MDLSLVFFLQNIFSSKRINVHSVSLSINDETQYVPLLSLSSISITYALSFILRKPFLEKNTINARLEIEILSNLDIV